MQGTFIQIAVFIIDTAAMLYVGAVLLRFLLQIARADFYNPLSQAIVKITNPLLKPLRKIIPGLGGLDLSALTLAFLAQIVFILLKIVALGGGINFLGGAVFLWALLAISYLLLGIYMVSMFIVAIASFIAPYSENPALSLMRQLIEPICAPVRKVIPPLGGFDFSFMAVVMIIVILQMLIKGIAHQNGIPL